MWSEPWNGYLNGHPRDWKGAHRGRSRPITATHFRLPIPPLVPLVSPAFITMDPALAIASRESETPQRLGATVIIFVISLFGASYPTFWLSFHARQGLPARRAAVSFPYVSAHSTHVSIPRILFFVGKHFGTGVILSTAFVHLLQDAFESLNSHRVRKISKVGDWTGLIVWVRWHNFE
jgi:hypothetical protein